MTGGQVAHRLSQEDSHRGQVGGQAQAEEAEACFMRQGMRKEQDETHACLGDDVRNNVVIGDPAGFFAKMLRLQHIGALSDLQGFHADEAGESWPMTGGNGDHRALQPPADGKRNENQQDQMR